MKQPLTHSQFICGISRLQYCVFDSELIDEMKLLGRGYIDKNKNEIAPRMPHKLALLLHPLLKGLKKIDHDEK